eukprot:ANDGO_05354.mRNA.1 hypothetical protein
MEERERVPIEDCVNPRQEEGHGDGDVDVDSGNAEKPLESDPNPARTAPCRQEPSEEEEEENNKTVSGKMSSEKLQVVKQMTRIVTLLTARKRIEKLKAQASALQKLKAAVASRQQNPPSSSASVARPSALTDTTSQEWCRCGMSSSTASPALSASSAPASASLLVVPNPAASVPAPGGSPLKNVFRPVCAKFLRGECFDANCPDEHVFKSADVLAEERSARLLERQQRKEQIQNEKQQRMLMMNRKRQNPGSMVWKAPKRSMSSDSLSTKESEMEKIAVKDNRDEKSTVVYNDDGDDDDILPSFLKNARIVQKR